MSSTASEFPLVALAGSPNCGKTAIFNALTGSRQKVANYAGVTVERKEGKFTTPSGLSVRLLDLPGTYSLRPNSPDEEIAERILTGKDEADRPQVLVAVVDATNLERSLSLILELREIKIPIILAMNMMDLARKRGMALELSIFSKELGIPVVATSAVKGEGLLSLMSQIESILASGAASQVSLPSIETPAERFRLIDEILKRSKLTPSRPDLWTDRMDRIVLHPVLGSVLLLAILGFMFQAIFTWAEPMMGLIEESLGALGTWVSSLLSEGPLQSLLVDGVIAGVGSVLVFLPQILILFLFIIVLEDLGYMARAAFLMDRLMGKVGLHGRAFIPLLSSFACAIPGIMATRSISDRKDRLVTIMIAPLMACSARLPVYTLLIAAFIPNETVLGPIRLQGLVMLSLFALGVIFALLIAFLARLVSKGSKPSLMIELPTYKVPHLKSVVIGLYERSRVFVRRAGTVILSLSILLWFLASYPKPPQGADKPAIHYSYAASMGHAMEPLLRPLGFDWRIATGLVPGFAAREVMVGALATVYAIENSGDEEGTEKALSERVRNDWSLAVALSLLVWYIFAPQCLSTLAVTRRETNSWRWPIFMLIYLTVLAYVAAWVTYRISVYLGWG